MTVMEGCEMKTVTTTQSEMTGREGQQGETAMVTTEKEESGGIVSWIIKFFSGGSDETGSSAVMSRSKKQQHGAGRWSRRTLKGHQGHKFKDVRGLAFHNDKLLVCDSDNNIVHILNQDYTCEKELGSFSGQFAKPFKPWSIAVSQDNLYFILDESNVQLVVCDQNNKVIRIITLPANSDPWCIALVKGFVIVTDVNGHRVLKYSLDGMYIGEFGRRRDGHTKFNLPYFVAVNSRDVIMVSDNGNHCIKCFDTQFNYLYKYGHRSTGNAQLWSPQSIAVDGADNVYVCDEGNDRISIWSEDTTWLHHLFHRELRWPRYIAVTADGDRIAGVSGSSRSWNEIVVFSK
ncbi:tripartite motif-containing protein 2-like [Ptychodera flava]|uniref:tripartite motif-containing protein 2-like n=1 Tax=Ptychodera flava TaxID=63121 RepID=UPI003969ED7C